MKSTALPLLVLLTVCGCGTPAQTGRFDPRPVDSGLPPLPAGTYDVSAVTRRPVPTKQRRPNYPSELRSRGIAGEGVVAFTVRTDGRVAEVWVVSATDARFGDAAAEAVSQWEFRPAELNGSPVNCRMTVPIAFTVN